MKTSLRKIGNSRGIIIPSRFLQECGIENIVSINIKDGELVISRPDQPRSGWSQQFAKTADDGEPPLLIEDSLPNTFDDKEWTW